MRAARASELASLPCIDLVRTGNGLIEGGGRDNIENRPDEYCPGNRKQASMAEGEQVPRSQELVRALRL